MTPDDERIAARRFAVLSALRASGVVMMLLGMWFWYGDIIRPGGDVVIGAPLFLLGIGESLLLPKLLHAPLAHAAAMKRVYDAVAIASDDAGHAIRLDGRPARTPAKAPLKLPSLALAEAVAAEWSAQGAKIDPRSMPMTGLACAAIDHVVPDPAAFAASIAAYGETDLLCYRADGPASLVARQREAWDPLLAWAGLRYDIAFTVTTGILHRAQPAATVQRLARAVGAFDAFALAPLSPLTGIGGSLVVTLALAEGALDADAAWSASQLDELWQIEHWGDDDLARATRAERRRDFDAAARFLVLALKSRR